MKSKITKKILTPFLIGFIFLFGLTALAATQTNYTNDNTSRQFTTSIKDSYSVSEPKDIQVSLTDRITNTKPEGLGLEMRVNDGANQQILDPNQSRANRIVNLGVLPSGEHKLTFTIPDGCGNFYGYSQFNGGTRFDNEYDCQYVRTLQVASSNTPGCTNPAALNYNPDASINDGSCRYDPGDTPGCTNLIALNYNPNATVDDGSCLYRPGGIRGCTNPAALNYNPDASENDGSCQYEDGEIRGCTDTGAGNYNADATVDDGSCVTYVYGCTDRKALNYNGNATASDDSCTYDALVTSSDFECSINNETWFDCEGRTFTLRDPNEGIFVRTEPQNSGEWGDWCTGDLNNGVSANFTPATTVSRFGENARVRFDFEKPGTLFDMVLCLDPSSSTKAQSHKNIKLKVFNMDFREI